MVAPVSRILVVDDEDGLRTSLVANLELAGYEVVDASNGLMAIEYVKQQPFDLVLTDVRMPGLNGLDTFREIRKIRPETEVVLMTAFTLETILDEALSEGIYTVVHKPFAMEDIIALIERAMEHRLILIFDDETEASAVVEALKQVGLRSEAVRDGYDAVQLVQERRVDVCVVDLVLLGLDGVELWEEVRRLDPKIPIVAMSGGSFPDMMHRIMSLGGYACLRKPLAVPELVRVIARARGASVGQ
jgi:two-component system, NtrC family, response regulator HydG